MKITNFLPKKGHVESFGLRAVELRRLGRFVVLAGPNGGGKSRILALLNQVASQNTQRKHTRNQQTQQIAQYQKYVEEHRNSNYANKEERIKHYELQIAVHQQRLLELDAIETDEDVEHIRLINFVPKSLRLQDPAHQARSSVISNAELAVRNIGVDMAGSSTLSYIQNRQDRYMEVTHPSFEASSEDRSKAVEEYTTLRDLIQALLGTTLSRTKDGLTTIFGKPFEQMALSDGQTVLLQLAIAVHPAHDEQGVVLVMDEPENHLHPAALIMILDRIQAAMAHAQIWIATHSVPLIAHLHELEPGCLHFVAEGRATYAGRTPEIVLRGLLGDDNEQERLLRFLDLPHALSASRFAASCLRPPAVAEHVQRDVQNDQIRSVMASLPRAGEPIRVLDFGAGKARLLAGLLEDTSDSDATLAIDYVAYEPDSENRVLCERQLLAAYGSADRRLGGTPDELFACCAEESFDVVVMCNVLHEIDPSQWLAILGPRGPVYRALKEGGYLLLVEDLRMPVGELPGPKGFFLLDTLHLFKLFLISRQEDIDQVRVSDARKNGRLKAHLIPRAFLGRITLESTRASIQALRDTSLRELQQLRTTGDASSAAGLLHGLWSQQFANCSLFLGIW